jgi:hypothetical protein
MGDSQMHIYAKQDMCLIAITDGKPVPKGPLGALPPWRAVLIARVAERAGVPLEGGTLEDLIAEAKRVGAEGELIWPLRS